MKTIKMTWLTCIALSMISCQTYYYRMVTKIERDGGVQRDIYTNDCPTEETFLFDTEGWECVRLDSNTVHDFFGHADHNEKAGKKKLYTKVSKRANSIDQFSKEIRTDKNKKFLAAPEESLKKQFRWFYTHHTFHCVYKKFDHPIPVPIDNYFTKEEQRFITQGDMSAYKGLNGLEISAIFEDIEPTLSQWFAHNWFEIVIGFFQTLEHGYDRLEADKEKIFATYLKGGDLDFMLGDTILNALNNFYNTTRFYELAEANAEFFEKEGDYYESIFQLLNYIIVSYELVIPGKLLTTNAHVINADTLAWKVNGIRMLTDDYTLTATYRTSNRWAFALTGIILLTAIVSISLIIRQRRVMP